VLAEDNPNPNPAAGLGNAAAFLTSGRLAPEAELKKSFKRYAVQHMAALGESRALEALEELAKRMKRKFARGAAGTRTAPAAARAFLVLLWKTLCTAVSLRNPNHNPYVVQVCVCFRWRWLPVGAGVASGVGLLPVQGALSTAP